MINFLCRVNLKRTIAILLFIFVILVSVFAIKKHSPADTTDESKWIEVQSQSLIQSLGLNGRIEPYEKRIITAPVAGKVKAVHASIGDMITAGTQIIEMESEQLYSEIQDAETMVIKARQSLQQLRDWKYSTQVMRAKRAIKVSEKTFNHLKRDYKENQKLLERGIIARIEVESLEQQLNSSEMELITQQDELRELLLQGEGESLRIAVRDLSNAQLKLDQLLSKQKQLNIIAPFDGVLLNIDENGEYGPVMVGSHVVVAQSMFQLINIDKLSVVAQAAENDLWQLRKGQHVTIAGEGFSREALSGKINSIGYMSTRDGYSDKEAMYSVIVHIDNLTSTQRQIIRPGMSAQIHIETYRNESAVIIPPDAILSREGKSWVVHRDTRKSNVAEKEVTIGKIVKEGVEVFGVDNGEISLVF